MTKTEFAGFIGNMVVILDGATGTNLMEESRYADWVVSGKLGAGKSAGTARSARGGM